MGKLSSEDKLILDAYRLGWDDCCTSDDSNKFTFSENSILRRAYIIGWSDYIVGDDVSSVDLQTDEEILNNIKAGEYGTESE